MFLKLYDVLLLKKSTQRKSLSKLPCRRPNPLQLLQHYLVFVSGRVGGPAVRPEAAEPFQISAFLFLNLLSFVYYRKTGHVRTRLSSDRITTISDLLSKLNAVKKGFAFVELFHFEKTLSLKIERWSSGCYFGENILYTNWNNFQLNFTLQWG